ncbi:MAG: helix-turn-helix transcriptional regulator [Bacteroidota bacterium]
MKKLSKGEYYGSQNSELSFDGIVLSHYAYDVPQTDLHYHENPYFMYVLKGNMGNWNARSKSQCPPGSIMFNNWQEPHYGSMHSDEASGFHLEFEKSWLERQGVSLQLLEGSQLIEHPQVHLLFAKLMQEYDLSDSYSKASVEVLLLQICEILSNLKDETHKTPPVWINRLKELLHYDTNELSLQYLSAQLNLHPVHISRAVKQYFSMNLGEYIRIQKLKKAIPLLLDPNTSLTEVAYQVGFFDQSHFNRVFKSYFQLSPSAYRKKQKIR